LPDIVRRMNECGLVYICTVL